MSHKLLNMLCKSVKLVRSVYNGRVAEEVFVKSSYFNTCLPSVRSTFVIPIDRPTIQNLEYIFKLSGMSTQTTTQSLDKKSKLKQIRETKILRQQAIQRIRSKLPEFSAWEYGCQAFATFFMFSM